MHATVTANGWCVTDDDQVMRVCYWVNEDGECEADEATGCLAGPDREGLYLTIKLNDPPAKLH